MSLTVMASPAARDPGPRVTKVCVADGGERGLDRVGGPQVLPLLAGEIVEREQLLQVVDDLRGHRGELGAVDLSEAVLRRCERRPCPPRPRSLPAPSPGPSPTSCKSLTQH